jgi:3',5'-cyclic-AMP phosphodiesterase
MGRDRPYDGDRMPTVRVVQISDTHVGAHRDEEVRPEDALEATVRAVLPLRPDVVLLTGDITDTGDPEAYRLVASLLEPLPVPTLAVAGNHDEPAAMRAYFGGESEMVLDAWRIVMVETYVAGETFGAVDVDAVLRRLGPDSTRPTLIALHHPPITPSSNPWFQLAGGADLVAALAARHDVRLVVGGHLHDTYRVVCGDVTYLGCPSTWYSLEHAGDAWRHDGGETGALRIDLFPDGRFDAAVVPRAEPSADVTTPLTRPARRAEDALRRTFDRYVMLHWTAASKPTRGEDTLWSASLDARGGDVEIVNHPTRTHAIDSIVAALTAAPEDRVFVGIDVPLGFPSGFANRLSKGSGNWRAVWAAIAEEVVDSPTNENNRFRAADRINVRAGMSPGPFWGCPIDLATASLPVARPSTFFGLDERRLVGRRLRDAGHTVATAWQLVGKGSAASETLLAVAALRRLTEHPHVGRRIRVWPFDTGCDPEPTRLGAGSVVVAEVVPELFGVDADTHGLREVAQVTGVCQHLARLDRDGTVGELFAPDLTPEELRSVEREEGWVLGA